MGGKPRERPLEEPRRRPTIFSAEDLSVAHPGAVVDRDMDVFPAHASRASTAIAMDPMPNEADLAQLLDIEVHESTRPRVLVAHDRARWFEPCEPIQSKATIDGHHGGDRPAVVLRDPQRAPPLSPTPLNLSALVARQLRWRSLRTR